MILPGEEDLAAIIANGSMRALRLHAFDRGIDGTDALPALREIVKAEYPSLLTTLGNALEARMGAEMYRSIINTYCNAWAVQALGARA